MNDSYGHFSDGGNEYIITTPATPRHWLNYLWNDTFNAFTSQVGFGEALAQDDMGRRALLVTNRSLFACEDGDYWTLNGLPVERDYTDFKCTHGLGYTTIQQSYRGLESSWTLFVPDQGNCEVWSVSLKNTSERNRSIKLVSYIQTALDGFYRTQGYFTSEAGFDKEYDAIVTKQYGCLDDKHEIRGYFLSSQSISGYDCSDSAFIGDYGSQQAPQALTNHGGCTNSTCVGEKVCLALENTLELGPGETIELQFIAGVTTDLPEIIRLRSRILHENGVEVELAAVKAKFASQIAGVTIDTPDQQFNHLVNHWLKHQTNMGSRWARVRHNGYRDLTGDCNCLGAVNPDLAWERLKRVLSYQYSNGFAPRTWLDGKILDKNFSDNTVWMTFAVYDIVMEKGDLSLLDEEIPFNDGSSASAYEHIKRSVNFLWNFRSDNGLIKMWGGDWNDCLEQVGMQGKGTSVWLSMAWFRANAMFGELAALSGNLDDAEEAEARGAEMKRLVNEVAWDGEYYTRAYTDDGEVLGSKQCDEGRIFLNSQTWAVFSGITTGDRDQQVAAAIDKYLDTDLGILVSHPAYSYRQPKLGHMTEKHPGVHENGGVYLHAAMWKVAIDTILKRNAKVQEGIEKILPFNDSWAEKKRCEPYVLCNSYYGEETGDSYGIAGQSWRTGSGPWLFKVTISYIFGLKPELDGLRIDPCLPPSWSECSVEKSFRNASYSIRYHQDSPQEGATVDKVVVDGNTIDGNLLPYEAGKSYTVDIYIK